MNSALFEQQKIFTSMDIDTGIATQSATQSATSRPQPQDLSRIASQLIGQLSIQTDSLSWQRTPPSWLQMMPYDVLNTILHFLAKRDFNDVMNELLDETVELRSYIKDSHRMERFKKHGIATHSLKTTPSILNIMHPTPNFTMAATPAADEYYLYCAWSRISGSILSKIPVRDENGLLLHYFGTVGRSWPSDQRDLDAMPEIRNLLNGLPNNPLVGELYEAIDLFIAYKLQILHDIIRQIKYNYKTNIAVPTEFGSRCSALTWYDNKPSFKMYLCQSNLVNNYRININNFLDKLLYNCGHLQSIRQKIYKQKRQLYTVNY